MFWVRNQKTWAEASAKQGLLLYWDHGLSELMPNPQTIWSSKAPVAPVEYRWVCWVRLFFHDQLIYNQYCCPLDIGGWIWMCKAWAIWAGQVTSFGAPGTGILGPHFTCASINLRAYLELPYFLVQFMHVSWETGLHLLTCSCLMRFLMNYPDVLWKLSNAHVLCVAYIKIVSFLEAAQRFLMKHNETIFQPGKSVSKFTSRRLSAKHAVPALYSELSCIVVVLFGKNLCEPFAEKMICSIFHQDRCNPHLCYSRPLLLGPLLVTEALALPHSL